MITKINKNEAPRKVLSLREYKERKGISSQSVNSRTSPAKQYPTPDHLIDLIYTEFKARDQIIKDIVIDYNKQIDELTSRQNSLLNIIKELIKKIDSPA